MTDEEIVERLRALQPTSKASELAVALGDMLGEPPQHSHLATYFFRAFHIPLRELSAAIARRDVEMSSFDSVLSPWLPGKADGSESSV